MSEYDIYEQEPLQKKSVNIFTWSKNNETRLPVLSTYAKKYLAIPATSTPSERVFSTAGNIVTTKRANLLPENVNKLVFLHHNKM